MIRLLAALAVISLSCSPYTPHRVESHADPLVEEDTDADVDAATDAESWDTIGEPVICSTNSICS